VRTGTLLRPALFAALLLAGCGGLDTPVATVTGRIAGARAGAYAYPLGHPSQKVPVSPADGAWRIEGVPTSVAAVVLFDGADRAELVPVRVEGGETNRVADRFGADAAVPEATRMPLAGAILAAATPDGGAVPREATFTVVGTDHAGLRSDVEDEGVATIGPLPAGRFDLDVGLRGFHGARMPIQVVAGASVAAQLELEVDLDDDAPGCGSTPGCDHDLTCGADGRCYACAADGDCETDETCDLALGLCRPTAGPATATCAACSGDADCASGVCVVEVGESDGYCSVPCAAGCPAGFACGGGDRCEAPTGCADWLQTMAMTCVEDAACAEDLAGGRCERTGVAPGFCTAPCATDADCQLGTFTAAMLVCAAGGHCAPP
jgi:hypothetical protein